MLYYLGRSSLFCCWRRLSSKQCHICCTFNHNFSTSKKHHPSIFRQDKDNILLSYRLYMYKMEGRLIILFLHMHNLNNLKLNLCMLRILKYHIVHNFKPLCHSIHLYNHIHERLPMGAYLFLYKIYS